jgi:hypothetical protein
MLVFHRFGVHRAGGTRFFEGFAGGGFRSGIEILKGAEKEKNLEGAISVSPSLLKGKRSADPP